MPLEKACLVKGCAGIPCFGQGFDVRRWACEAHKHLIGFAGAPPPVPATGEARAVAPHSSRASPLVSKRVIKPRDGGKTDQGSLL